MSKFKATSLAVLSTTRGYNVSDNQSPNSFQTSSPPQVNKRKKRGRGKNREISLEMFTNYSGDEIPSPHQLAADGNLEDLKALLEALGTTIKETDENGASLLHHAAAHNQVGVMQYLIDSGIDLHTFDQDDNTPLHIAVAKSHVDAVHLLLNNGASDTILNKAMHAPLHIVMQNNDTLVLAAFLEHPIDIVVTGYRKRTALHVAAEKDHLDVCKVLHNSILIESEFKKVGGFRLCASDEDELTPIHLAARVGSYRVLDFMMSKAIEHGYSPEIVLSFLDEENSTPLHAAVDGGHLEVVEVLLKYKAQPDVLKGKQLPPFLLASTQGKLKMMQLMVQYSGKDIVHCRDQYGQTALHRCAQAINSAQTISFLVENGAVVDSVDDQGKTPLMSTIIAGSLAGMKVLLAKGASILIKDKVGFNPLHHAVKQKRRLIISCLLELQQARDLVTDCDNQGNSPIHYALKLSLNNIVALMVTSATQFKNIKDVKGNNYIHLAAHSGDWKALAILLDIPECHRLLNETNVHGATPLHLAAGEGHVRAVEILLAHGAMIHKCHSGKTPFQFACFKGHAEVAKITYEAHPFQLSWTDDSGNTALHHGAESGSPWVITLLLNIGVPVILNHNQESFFEIIMDKHFTKCAMAVIKHERWQECLDVVGFDHHHPMISLIQSMPEVAKMVLDRSHSKAKFAREDAHYWECYNFKYLRLNTDAQTEEQDPNEEDDENDSMVAPVIKYKGSTASKGPAPRYRQKRATSHLDVLKDMVKYNRLPLLVHPVTESYLKTKWRNYGRWIQLFFTFLFILQVAFLILFTFLSPRPADLLSNTGVNVTCNSLNSTENCTLDSTPQFGPASQIARFITIGITTLNLLSWLMSVIKVGVAESLNITRNTYVLIDGLAVFFTLLYVLPWTPSLFQSVIWEAGALASLFTWFSLVLKLQLFDLVGVYITMFLAITRTVFQVLLICFFFIAAFALSLYILAGNLDIFSNIGYSLFSNFGHLLGEIDYAYYIQQDIQGNTLFGTLTFMFVIILAILMAIVIQNLLIGLAVGDIEKIRLNAIAEKRALEIGYYSHIDHVMPNKLLWKLDKGSYKKFPNQKVFFTRYIWRYTWRLIKGEDPTNDEDNVDSVSLQWSSNNSDYVSRQLATMKQKIEELTASQEKLVEMITQMHAKQVTAQSNSRLNEREDPKIEDTGSRA